MKKIQYTINKKHPTKKGGITMSLNGIKETVSCITEDIKGGLEIMGRYVLRHDIRSKITILDREKGVKLFEKDRNTTDEYPLVKLVALVFAALAGIAVIAIGLSAGASRKKVIKAQKSEIKRLRKLCKGAGVDTSIKKK